jgi:beta-glucosidase
MNDPASLVARMTLEEKAALTVGRDFWHLGGVARLGLREVMVADGPHGLRVQRSEPDHLGKNEAVEAVCFPAASALAASFDVDLLREVGDALGEESRALGVGVLLGPAINIKRSPLNGRNFEYFSEDPYLTGELAASYIDGVQGRGVGTSLKHFAVNNQETRRRSVSAEVDERTLREIYLAAFETPVRRSRPWTVMSSYNRVNGAYVGESHRLLTEVLRGEWGFEGFVVSDWGAVSDRVAALAAGLDVKMPGADVEAAAQVVAAVEDGRLPVEVLDEAARRVTAIALRCADGGQGSGGVGGAGPRQYDRDAHHALAVRAATESAVLLTNRDGLLPLDGAQDVVFIGEFAKTPRYQGGGSSHVAAFRVVSALDAAEGTSWKRGFSTASDETDPDLLADAVRAAQASQVAVIFAGLPDSYESEGYDRPHMHLPDNQNALIHAVAAVQPNTVVVLHAGSPVEMPWKDEVGAILDLYLGGQGVGQATVDLLYGRANPAGRLPETFPLRAQDNPSYLNFPGDQRVDYAEGVFVGYRYYDAKDMEVAFPFGHGLSYTTFKYGNLTVSREAVDDAGQVSVSIAVTNTGDRPGTETVQLYVAPPGGVGAGRPPRELKGFARVALEPGETGTATFSLDKRSFARWDIDAADWVCPSGTYRIEVGASSRDIRAGADLAITSSWIPPLVVTKDTTAEQLLAHPEIKELTVQVCQMLSKETTSGDANPINAALIKASQLQSPLRVLRMVADLSEAALTQLVADLNGALGTAPDLPPHQNPREAHLHGI